MAIKTIVIPMGLVKASQVSSPGIAVPDFPYDQIQASGYVTNGDTGQVYYYNAQTEQWYYKIGTLLYPLGISWQPSPSSKLACTGGVDALRFRLSFMFVGTQVTQSFKAEIGENKTSGSFDSWWEKIQSFTIPASSTPVRVSSVFIDIPIPTGKAGKDFGAYLKKNQVFITEGIDSTPYYYNVGSILSTEGEFSELAITSFQKV